MAGSLFPVTGDSSREGTDPPMDSETERPGSRVRPLDAVERRVLGVLIEKGKTTPEAYPLSLNAIITGCNQKNNRDPLMNVDEDQVGRALETLRAAGVVAEIYGSGRVPRYRHYGYEWFGGIEKEDLSILAELLLRGEQSEGDLRGRASRMDPIADLQILRTKLDGLAERYAAHPPAPTAAGAPRADLPIGVWVHIAETDEAAWADAARLGQVDPARPGWPPAIIGSPETVTEGIRDYQRRLDPTHLLLRPVVPGMTQAETMHRLELLADRVLPALR